MFSRRGSEDATVNKIQNSILYFFYYFLNFYKFFQFKSLRLFPVFQICGNSAVSTTIKRFLAYLKFYLYTVESYLRKLIAK